MPTGYTNKIYENKPISLKEFALDCAHAFGACITLREEPDAEIPDHFDVDDYYLKHYNEAIDKLDKFNKMSDDELDKQRLEEYSNEVIVINNYNVEKELLKKRYETMLAEVMLWESPSEDHIEFKKFMIQQLKQSIDWDCTLTPRPTLETLDEYKKQMKQRLEKSIERYKEENIKENDRVEAKKSLD